jgi:hypothetical protein
MDILVIFHSVIILAIIFGILYQVYRNIFSKIDTPENEPET